MQDLTQKAYSSFSNRDIVPLKKLSNTKYVLASLKVVEYDVHDKPLRMIGSIIDITERKNMELRLLGTKKVNLLNFIVIKY